jgi:hypothetical protein
MTKILMTPALHAALLTLRKADERASVAEGSYQADVAYEDLGEAVNVVCAVLNPEIER